MISGGSTDMEIERRSKGNQAPECLDGVLNEMQLSTLSKTEGFGWELAFIRRPLFQDIIPVLIHPENDKLVILEGDGALNTQPDIEFRQ
jgi:hypothetical protein